VGSPSVGGGSGRGGDWDPETDPLYYMIYYINQPHTYSPILAAEEEGGDGLLTGGEHLHPPDLLRERGDGDEVLRLEEGDRLLGERLVDI
jgi:hypothetical protein